MKIRSWALVVLFVSITILSLAQGNESASLKQGEYSVRITLQNGVSKSPIRNATISVDSLNLTFSNQVDGAYVIHLPAGHHTLSITATGYQDIYQPIAVHDDGHFRLRMYRRVQRNDKINIGLYPIKMKFENTYKREGPILGIGLGTGHSRHADSYRQTDNGRFIEKSGYRLITLSLDAGWGFTPNFIVLYSFKYSPANTTISPYESVYHGLKLNISPKHWSRGIIILGGGYQAANDKQGFLADGYLLNGGFAYEVSPHITFELSHFVGSLDDSIDLSQGQRFLKTTTEFLILFSVNYVFY